MGKRLLLLENEDPDNTYITIKPLTNSGKIKPIAVWSQHIARY